MKIPEQKQILQPLSKILKHGLLMMIKNPALYLLFVAAGLIQSCLSIDHIVLFLLAVITAKKYFSSTGVGNDIGVLPVVQGQTIFILAALVEVAYNFQSYGQFVPMIGDPISAIFASSFAISLMVQLKAKLCSAKGGVKHNLMGWLRAVRMILRSGKLPCTNFLIAGVIYGIIQTLAMMGTFLLAYSPVTFWVSFFALKPLGTAFIVSYICLVVMGCETSNAVVA